MFNKLCSSLSPRGLSKKLAEPLLAMGYIYQGDKKGFVYSI